MELFTVVLLTLRRSAISSLEAFPMLIRTERTTKSVSESLKQQVNVSLRASVSFTDLKFNFKN
jgi:hypothetical protein